MRGIARWNGSVWSPIANGITGAGLSSVLALAVLANGDLIAGGDFQQMNGVTADGIARWDGTAWSALGSGLSLSSGRPAVHALVAMPNGDLVAGGVIDGAGGAPALSVARWDGIGWSPLGQGVSGGVIGLAALANGDLVATGGAAGVNRWNGTAWSGFGTGAPGARTVTVMGSRIAVGGVLRSAGGIAARSVAEWDGSAWAALGEGFDSAIEALLALRSGDLVVGGTFQSAPGGVAASSIARRSGANWAPLGPGLTSSVTGVGPRVAALVELPNGDLVAGGSFTHAGVAADNLARWDGTAWSALGTGVVGSVEALVVMPGGDVVAGGTFQIAGGVAAARIARWNGSAWSPIGAGFNGNVSALCVLPNGDLVAGGSFTASAGQQMLGLARWNGSSWAASTTFDRPVQALTVLGNGDLVAAGDFRFVGGSSMGPIARFDGVRWSPLAGLVGRVGALAVLANGDLAVAGSFSVVGQSVISIARWDGSAWESLVGKIVDCNALAVLPDGDLAVGGAFFAIDGAVAASLAEITTTCPATVGSFGAGCSGPAGPVALTADRGAWLGRTFTATVTGFGPSSFGLAAIGLTQVSVPLSQLHPAALPGCSLLALPDVRIDFLVPTAGAATIAIAVPDDPQLLGIAAQLQAAQVEVVLGAISSVSSSNGLQVVVGAF